jgi:hypothetical protein
LVFAGCQALGAKHSPSLLSSVTLLLMAEGFELKSPSSSEMSAAEHIALLSARTTDSNLPQRVVRLPQNGP